MVTNIEYESGNVPKSLSRKRQAASIDRARALEYEDYLETHWSLFPYTTEEICPGCGQEIGREHSDDCSISGIESRLA